jgi:hypothetical protein
MLEDVPPFLWIRHISHGRFCFGFGFVYDGADIDIFIGSEVFLVDDVSDFFSGKFFILCGFRDIALIGARADIESELLFDSISLDDLVVDSA